MKDWRTTLLSPRDTVRLALSKIDLAATNIGLVVDLGQKLLGTVTDGDIRRGLLSGLSLDDPVEKCMFVNPTTAIVNESQASILSKMRRFLLHQIPVIDEQGRVVDLALIDDYLVREMRQNWVVVMAGGLGSRLKELTHSIPKPMLMVGRRPILETIVSNLVSQGFQNVWIAVNYLADQIEDYFGDGKKWGVSIKYIKEEKRLGTSGALSLLPENPRMPTLVTNADILANINYCDMLDAHLASQSVATMAVRDYEYEIPYGVVHSDDGTILRLNEKPIHTVLVNAGVYVISPDAMQHVPRNTFYDMPQLFEKLIQLGYKTRCHKVSGYWLDIGRYDDFCKANQDFDDVFIQDIITNFNGK